MGYDPVDYFDFGANNQNDSIKTRFGSKTVLVSLIPKEHGEIIKPRFMGNPSWTQTTAGDKTKIIQCRPNSYSLWRLSI